MTMRTTIAEQQALIDAYRERMAVKDATIAELRVQLGRTARQLDGMRAALACANSLGRTQARAPADIALPPVAD